MDIVKPTVLDILDTKSPALSATTDMPIVETKPDASNEGKPPELEADKAETPAEEVKTTSESATEHTEEAPGEPAAVKPPRGVQKRLDELARQREEQRARAEAAERRLDLLLTQQPKPASAEVSVEDVEPVRPTRAAFSDPDTYELALSDYADQKASWAAKREVQQAIANHQRQQMEQAQANAQRELQQSYKARVDKAIEKYSDYHEIAESADVQISMPMAVAIMKSEHGPDVAYFLGSHTDEAKRIFSLSPELQLVEFGMIVAKLATPQPKPTTAAPKPLKPIAASATASTGESEEEPNMETYANRRRKALVEEQSEHVRRTRH